MYFGSAPDELLPGARNAIGTCLAVNAGERVALVADDASRPVAASLEHALAESGASADCLLIESVAARPMTAAPREILDALGRADVGILCVQPREGELAARMSIVNTIE